MTLPERSKRKSRMAGRYARKVHKDFDLVTISVTLPEPVYLANTISVSFDAKR